MMCFISYLPNHTRQISVIYSINPSISQTAFQWHVHVQAHYLHLLSNLQHQDISHVHDHGNRDTVIPNCCHQLDYCRGYDLYDEPSVR